MKKTGILLVLIFVFSVAVSAHPPSAIDVNFNSSTKELNVVMAHKVKDKTNHYIHEIEVFLNGKKIVKQDASVQTDNEKQAVKYILPDAKDGDKIEVMGDCNKFGNKKVKIIAGKTKKGKKGKK